MKESLLILTSLVEKFEVDFYTTTAEPRKIFMQGRFSPAAFLKVKNVLESESIQYDSSICDSNGFVHLRFMCEDKNAEVTLT